MALGNGAATPSHDACQCRVIMAAAVAQGFSHHRDIVTGLAFRDDTHVLYSGSFDRTVKIWSLDDRAYVDTLYGHQSEVHCRASSTGSQAAGQDDAGQSASQVSGVCFMLQEACTGPVCFLFSKRTALTVRPAGLSNNSVCNV